MAYDEGLAQIMRDALQEESGIAEKKMFGGLCFLLSGNMVAGVTSEGFMFRVGKEQEEVALAIEGVAPLSFTGRKMGGMVEADGSILDYDKQFHEVMKLAIQNAKALPAK